MARQIYAASSLAATESSECSKNKPSASHLPVHLTSPNSLTISQIESALTRLPSDDNGANSIINCSNNRRLLGNESNAPRLSRIRDFSAAINISLNGLSISRDLVGSCVLMLSLSQAENKILAARKNGCNQWQNRQRPLGTSTIQKAHQTPYSTPLSPNKISGHNGSIQNSMKSALLLHQG